MNLMDIQAVEAKLCDVTVTPIRIVKKSSHHEQNTKYLDYDEFKFKTDQNYYELSRCEKKSTPSKYVQLLNVIEDIGKDVRPTYAGNKNSVEKLKRSLIHARILVRECLIENEKNAK